MMYDLDNYLVRTGYYASGQGDQKALRRRKGYIWKCETCGKRISHGAKHCIKHRPNWLGGFQK